jgi:hypothetical protein
MPDHRAAEARKTAFSVASQLRHDLSSNKLILSFPRPRSDSEVGTQANAGIQVVMGAIHVKNCSILIRINLGYEMVNRVFSGSISGLN